jgi:hypothetical protein
MLRMCRWASVISVAAGIAVVSSSARADKAGQQQATAEAQEAIANCNEGSWNDAANKFTAEGGKGVLVSGNFPQFPEPCAKRKAANIGPNGGVKLDFGNYLSAFDGLSFSLQSPGTISGLSWVESVASGGMKTNQGNALGGPTAGVGGRLGFAISVPLDSPTGPPKSIVITPFLQTDYLNQKTNDVFPNGNVIGVTNNYDATVGVMFGPTIGTNQMVYGVVGATMLNVTERVNFAPLQSSTTKDVPGLVLGLGGQVIPEGWQVFGNPVSLYIEANHTFLQNIQFNTPMSSPAFNYTNRVSLNSVVGGVSVHFTPTSRGLTTYELLYEDPYAR